MTRLYRQIFFALASLIVAHAANSEAPDCPPAADLKLHVGQYELKLNNKKPICIKLGGTFKITILNPPGSGATVNSGDVTAVEKTGVSVSIEGNNISTTNKLAITVDGTADVDDIFDFWITVRGVGTLDPKIRVVDNDVMMNVQSAALYNTLDTLGLSLEEANKLRPPEEPAE